MNLRITKINQIVIIYIFIQLESLIFKIKVHLLNSDIIIYLIFQLGLLKIENVTLSINDNVIFTCGLNYTGSI